MANHGKTGQTEQDFVAELIDSTEDHEEELPRWHRHISLVILIMALLSALGAVLAGMTANRAVIERTEEILEVSDLEGDRIFVEMLKTKHDILTALGESLDQDELETISLFEREMQELSREAVNEEAMVQTSSRANHLLTISVALLSMGTALCGMSIIANRKALWMVGIGIGAVALICMGVGVHVVFS